MDELDKRIEPMPEDLYNQILDSESDYSPLEIREMELASLKAKQSWLFNSVVAHYLSDTTGTLSDSLNVVLQNAPFPEGRYLLALKQMAENDTTAAASTLQAIPSSFELSNEQQAIFNDYLSCTHSATNGTNPGLIWISHDGSGAADKDIFETGSPNFCGLSTITMLHDTNLVFFGGFTINDTF